MPEDMPDTFYDLLEQLLVYKYKQRKSAGQLLNHGFIQLHKDVFSVENVILEATNPELADGSRIARTQSFAIRGSVGRHTMVLDYQKFERSLTTLLATLLTRKELENFVEAVHEASKNEMEEEKVEYSTELTNQVLDIIKVSRLKDILKENGTNDEM